MHGLKTKLEYILKHNTFFSMVFRTIASTCVRLVGLFVPLDENAVLFSGLNRGYNDSPRAIYEYMISVPKYGKFRYIWALDNPDGVDIPGNCKKIKSDTFKYFITSLSCKYWITCVNIERGLKYKKKKTVYLNTWHGTPIKTVGNSASGRKDFNFSHIDYFCSAGKYEEKIYIRDFKLKPQSIINTGLPRNDELYGVTDQNVTAIKKELGLPLDKKVILYAPTWRDSVDGGKTYAIRPPIDINLWRNKLADNYILLFRVHHYTTKLLGIQFDDFVRDYTNYARINDLLKVSDLLISDYSATIFDYSILEKPIICFGYDYDSYKEERGLYFDLNKEMPGGVVKDQNGVIEKILKCDYGSECEKTKEFKNKFLNYGGTATKECVNVLFGNINE